MLLRFGGLKVVRLKLTEAAEELPEEGMLAADRS